MEAETILEELKICQKKEEVKKTELLMILKKYAQIISVHDLMLATSAMREDGKYVQAQYREKYLKIYIKYFIMRMKEVLDYENKNDEKIDMNKLRDSFHLLETTFEKERNEYFNSDKFPLIYVITSLYTTFILEEPIHPVGSEFPGNLKVTQEKGIYYCPVKDNQKDNPSAICHLCLAEQTPNI